MPRAEGYERRPQNRLLAAPAPKWSRKATGRSPFPTIDQDFGISLLGIQLQLLMEANISCGLDVFNLTR